MNESGATRDVPFDVDHAAVAPNLPGPSFETRYLQTYVGENKAAKIGDIAKVTYRSRYVDNND